MKLVKKHNKNISYDNLIFYKEFDKSEPTYIISSTPQLHDSVALGTVDEIVKKYRKSPAFLGKNRKSVTKKK